MAGSNFLENLKKAVDTGEFNSEAAKKIIEIDKLADEKLSTMTKSGEVLDDSKLAKAIVDRAKLGGVKTVSEEEALALNSEYEKKMKDIEDLDTENKRIAELTNVIDKQVATLVEIEDMVSLSIKDMLSFVKELETKFAKEIEAKDPMFTVLIQNIEKVKKVYEPTQLEKV